MKKALKKKENVFTNENWKALLSGDGELFAFIVCDGNVSLISHTHRSKSGAMMNF